MFNFFKKNKPKCVIEDYFNDFNDFNYNADDLNPALDRVKNYYNDLNERNRKILCAKLRIADQLKDKILKECGFFKDDDISISHTFYVDCIANPSVELKIKRDENYTDIIKIELCDFLYKKMLIEIADVIYKRRSVETHEPMKKIEELKKC